jgi:hypothetical protein
MIRHNEERQGRMTDEIRRQLGSPGTMRFLRSLPALQVEQDMPDALQDLLCELERVEAKQARRP